MKKFIIVILSSILGISTLFAQQNVRDIIKEGVQLHDQKKYREAIKQYEKALKLNPESMPATYEMALSYLALKDYRNASKYSTKIINANDKDLLVKAYCVKSEALAKMDKIDDAITLLQRAMINNPNDYSLHFNLALNYFQKNDIPHTLLHVERAIDLNKSHSGAYLLYAYALNDNDRWVQSILAFQMFLLLEPDSQRSKNAFNEMLQTMRIKTQTDTPAKRSFFQQQMRVETKKKDTPPPLSNIEGLNRTNLYKSITDTRDALLDKNPDTEQYVLFKEVTKAFYSNLSVQSKVNNLGTIWTFYIPLFTRIAESEYFDTFTRYISVSYFPESYEWWENNKDKAKEFVNWFESGDARN